MDAGATIGRLLEIEARFGRSRGERNADRTLDLDLIDHAGLVMQSPRLTLPHPRAHERGFVMGPLSEIGLTASELAASASVARDARPAR
jgi:2-amino-4-hydroxy-6-hydroxymethyldihydropteridine diphosphokinase